MLMWFWSVQCIGVPITLRNYTQAHTRVYAQAWTHILEMSQMEIHAGRNPLQMVCCLAKVADFYEIMRMDLVHDRASPTITLDYFSVCQQRQGLITAVRYNNIMFLFDCATLLANK